MSLASNEPNAAESDQTPIVEASIQEEEAAATTAAAAAAAVEDAPVESNVVVAESDALKPRIEDEDGDRLENAEDRDEPSADAQIEQQMDLAIQQDIAEQQLELEQRDEEAVAVAADVAGVNLAFEADEEAVEVAPAEGVQDEELVEEEAAAAAAAEDDGEPYPVDGEDEEQNFINQLANIIQARGNNLRRYLNNVFLNRLNRNNYDNLENDDEDEAARNVNMDEDEEEDDEEDEDLEEEEEDFDEDEEDEDEEEEEVVQEVEDYEQIQKPESINYDTALPSSHDYLGQNFTTITSPKLIHDINDEITIPILTLPGNDDFHATSNSVQLLPGQVMPLYFYAPLQVQMLKKRLKEPDPSVGFTLSAKYLRKILRSQAGTSEQPPPEQPQQQQSSANTTTNAEDLEENMNIGILAEIISSRDEDGDGPIDQNTMMPGANGLILKVRGRERFEILSARRDITGNVVARVRILPEFLFERNPLSQHSPRGAFFLYDAYLRKTNASLPAAAKHASLNAKAEAYNMAMPHPAWIYRKHDCFYTIDLIMKELNDTFQIAIAAASEPGTSSRVDEADDDLEADQRRSSELGCFGEPLLFSNWLLNNFPFDNMMRFKCLKLNCVNQRLMYMHDLLKSFTNITCRACGTHLCSKSDVFSMSKQGFMQAYLNPGGFVHETLTVYKAKNLRLMSSRPTTANSWFPGYGWIIASCGHCYAHIGWRFSTTNANLKPAKFWGLTRKAVEYTYNREDDETAPPVVVSGQEPPEPRPTSQPVEEEVS